MSTLYVNADWSAIVPAGSAAAAFGVQPKDAKRLGLDTLAVSDGADAPDPAVEQVAPTTMTSANVIPEPVAPEAKEAPAPANKAALKPANKGAARKEPVDGDSH